MILGARNSPPASVKWTPSVRRITTPSIVLVNLPPGHAAASRSTTESVVRVLGRHLADQLVVDGQARRVVLGPRCAVGLLALVGARCGEEHHAGARRRDQLRRRLQLALHVGGERRVQDVGPGALVLAVDHLPAPGQEHDDVRLDLARSRPATGTARAGRPAARPARAGEPLHAGRRVVARPHELDLGPVDDAAAEDALVREDVAVLVLLRRVGQTQPEGQGHRVAEEQHAHRRRRRRRRPASWSWSWSARGADAGPEAPCWRRPSSRSWRRPPRPARHRRRRAPPARPATG